MQDCMQQEDCWLVKQAVSVMVSDGNGDPQQVCLLALCFHSSQNLYLVEEANLSAGLIGEMSGLENRPIQLRLVSC